MSNTDKLEKLVESGALTLRYSHKSEKKMTGAEWYARFEEELAAEPAYMKKATLYHINNIYKAAKKASGLK